MSVKLSMLLHHENEMIRMQEKLRWSKVGPCSRNTSPLPSFRVVKLSGLSQPSPLDKNQSPSPVYYRLGALLSSNGVRRESQRKQIFSFFTILPSSPLFSLTMLPSNGHQQLGPSDPRLGRRPSDSRGGLGVRPPCTEFDKAYFQAYSHVGIHEEMIKVWF